MAEKPVIVLGIGNPLMGDEGIGNALIELLGVRTDEFPEIEFIDAGTGGMNILHLIAGRKKAILIDCALMGTGPGTIRRFTPDDIRTVKKLPGRSLHEADIVRIIELSKRLGELPQEVIFFGIEPLSIQEKPALSDILKAGIEHYLKVLSAELAC